MSVLVLLSFVVFCALLRTPWPQKYGRCQADADHVFRCAARETTTQLARDVGRYEQELGDLNMVGASFHAGCRCFFVMHMPHPVQE